MLPAHIELNVIRTCEYTGGVTLCSGSVCGRGQLLRWSSFKLTRGQDLGQRSESFDLIHKYRD